MIFINGKWWHIHTFMFHWSSKIIDQARALHQNCFFPKIDQVIIFFRFIFSQLIDSIHSSAIKIAVQLSVWLIELSTIHFELHWIQIAISNSKNKHFKYISHPKWESWIWIWHDMACLVGCLMFIVRVESLFGVFVFVPFAFRLYYQLKWI